MHDMADIQADIDELQAKKWHLVQFLRRYESTTQDLDVDAYCAEGVRNAIINKINLLTEGIRALERQLYIQEKPGDL